MSRGFRLLEGCELGSRPWERALPACLPWAPAAAAVGQPLGKPFTVGLLSVGHWRCDSGQLKGRSVQQPYSGLLLPGLVPASSTGLL